MITAKKSCNATDLDNQCSATETCYQSEVSRLGACACREGFIRINDTFCQAPTQPNGTPAVKTSSLVDHNSSSNVVATVVPTFVILIVICVVYIGYKYKLHSWIKNRINQRSTNYDEFMIGQDLDDDPPLH